jgi:D-alanyl-D-alanine carboxypeptidase/D-alanyl-D-alanine-endopeptidase (penicillin-binding protein 4)
MKRLLIFGLMFLGGCASFAPPRQSSDPVRLLQNDIDTVLSDSIFRQTLASLEIVSLNSGQVLYERNSKLLMHPASNLKLLTSATALQVLGEDFRFKTAVLVDSLQSGDIVAGNLYLKGFGDPDLKSSDLDSLAATLRSIGIRLITGDIVADDSYFDDLYWGNGWMWDDEPDPDAMFISALSVNKNCVVVTVEPTSVQSDSVIVTINPPTSFISVLSTARTVDDSAKCSLKVSRLFKERLNTITVSGDMPRNATAHRNRISVRQPALLAAELLKKSLQLDSLTVLGQARLAMAPPGTVEIASCSRPIDSVLIAMNKKSDNLSAENILKTIGAKQRGLPGGAKNGIYVENEFLSSFGIDTSACFIADGSGVSHYNLLTVDNIMRLLVGMTRRPDPFHLIYASLPIAGVDGTLENRMIGTAAQGNVRAKTGTISGTSSLSGYVTTRDGELLACSMVMEHFVLPPRYFQYAQDTICELLARFSRKQSAAASR